MVLSAIHPTVTATRSNRAHARSNRNSVFETIVGGLGFGRSSVSSDPVKSEKSSGSSFLKEGVKVAAAQAAIEGVKTANKSFWGIDVASYATSAFSCVSDMDLKTKAIIAVVASIAGYILYKRYTNNPTVNVNNKVDININLNISSLPKTLDVEKKVITKDNGCQINLDVVPKS
jgi:hypothetical protein